MDRKRLTDAGPYFARSLENFEKLVAAAPTAVEIQSHFGMVLAAQGKWLDQTGKPADAKTALAAAVEHQREAMKLGKNPASCRLALASHLTELADVNRKLGEYDEAARLALEVPKVVPLSSRAPACYDAAQVLARLVTQIEPMALKARGRRPRSQGSELPEPVGRSAPRGHGRRPRDRRADQVQPGHQGSRVASEVSEHDVEPGRRPEVIGITQHSRGGCTFRTDSRRDGLQRAIDRRPGKSAKMSAGRGVGIRAGPALTACTGSGGEFTPGPSGTRRSIEGQENQRRLTRYTRGRPPSQSRAHSDNRKWWRVHARTVWNA